MVFNFPDEMISGIDDQKGRLSGLILAVDEKVFVMNVEPTKYVGQIQPAKE